MSPPAPDSFQAGASPSKGTVPDWIHGDGSNATCLADVAIHVAGSAMRDELLHAVRRIDWRFLMPRPSLGHVALLGDDDPELVRALRWFSESLSMLDLDWSFPEQQAPRFDQVVVRSRCAHRVQNAAALVEPGGVLYWEIERGGPLRCWRSLLVDIAGRALHAVHPWNRSKPYEPRTMRSIRMHFERYGFDNVRWHWHRPGFQDALDIVPIQNDTVLDHVFGKHNGRTRGRIKRGIGHLLQRMGLLHVLVPCLSIMATRRTSTDDGTTPVEA